MEHTWKLQTEDKCPRCQQPAEGKNHISQCQEMAAVKRWETSLQKLDDLRQTEQMEPRIQQEWQWNIGQPTPPNNKQSEVAKEQEAVGWDLILEGSASKKWCEQQANHWKAYKSQKSSKCWTTELLKKLMRIAWDMWQHHNKVLHEELDNQALILEVEINICITAYTTLDHRNLHQVQH